MTKRVTMTSKPTPRPATPEASADNWVNSRTTDEEMKRLTFDVPANLHRRIKVACAKKGVKMADDLRELLERHYPE